MFKKESVFPFYCYVLNKGTTGTILTYFVRRGPLSGIEPRTYRMYVKLLS